ncbi:hypothetical protein PVK06_017812 [Gossypium arboreum]|uniref:Peptidase C1A papain C-terminal domain-containing protein n=1 Tax=Gossypium arboreum TaxID=29729 RepID=A0ABR0Q472_GOSAR|nr:hypothetical protein PVK06_017812 [Gossypium arboreum]
MTDAFEYIIENHGLTTEESYPYQEMQGTCDTVTIVGYGTSEESLNYWLVKNSWGETWGEKVYFRIERGVNKCGIAMKAS